MKEYQILGSYRGEEVSLANTGSAAKAEGFYKAAIKPGGLPVSGVRVTADGIEISAGELARRAEAERNA
jgi:hypothetical protein